MSDCTPRMTAQCNTVLESGPAVPKECPSWTACLPFGASLVSNSGCIDYIPGTNVPVDGVYSKITIVNGCIVSAELAGIPIYTSPPCAPIPTPCDGGGGVLPDPSPTIGNLFQYDANGRPLVKLSIQPGNGISISGDGTTTSPLIITNTQQVAQAIQIQPGNSAIRISGSGTASDPFKISHSPTNMEGPQGLYTFDEFGHLIGYNPSQTSMYVTGIIEGDGISASMNPNTGVATIALAEPANVITGSYRFGSFDVEFYRNRLIRITPQFTAPEGTYQFGNYNVTIDKYGAVEDVQYIAPPPPEPIHWSKQFTDTAQLVREMNFTLVRSSSVRAAYTGTLPSATTMSIYIDGQLIGNQIVTNTSRIDVLPIAIYGVGQHNIRVQTTTETGFVSPGIIDVCLTDVL